MNKQDKLVTSTDKAGKYSAEETSLLAALAAFGNSVKGRGPADRVLKSLDGDAKVVGTHVLNKGNTGSQHGVSKKAVGVVVKKAASAARKKGDISDRLVKWGSRVG